MKQSIAMLAAVAALTTAFSAHSQEVYPLGEEDPSSTYVSVPERAIVLTGGQNGVHRDVLGVLYDTEKTFDDPDAPRFLLIDRKGNTVFGIGGAFEGVLQYDFNGAVDDYGMACNEIPVPFNPADRSRLGATASHSTLLFNLLHQTRLGVMSAYIQANFSGGNYGFKLKQAYLRLNHVTFGLARSTFQDALASPATIDYAGPVGMIDRKNFGLQYKINYKSGFGWAIAAEMPSASYTTIPDCSESISQRVPDIPAYVQYQWADGASHVRASAIMRNLAYRDLITSDNHIVTGYGAQLSGAIQCTPFASVIYQASYGKGIAAYQCDAEDLGYDLIPDPDAAGRLEAPRSFGFAGGLQITPCDRLLITSTYSMMRLYDQEQLGADAYRRTNYAVVNAFYNPTPELQLGVEYVHGTRTDMSHLSGHANRVQAMVKYSF